MGAHGVCVSALGRGGTGRQENKWGKITNGASGSCFACVVTAIKQRHGCGDDRSDHVGQRGGMRGNPGQRRACIVI